MNSTSAEMWSYKKLSLKSTEIGHFRLIYVKKTTVLTNSYIIMI